MCCVSKYLRLFVVPFLVVLSANAQAEGQYLIRFQNHISSVQARQKLEDNGFIVNRFLSEISLYVATPNPRMGEAKAVKRLTRTSLTKYIEKDLPLWHALETPNDPLFSNQTYLRQIEADQAWIRSTGKKAVVVAISDTGVDMAHNDLQNQIWTNTREVPGNGIDDDNNGYIDDVHGWDFVQNDNNPTDENIHGTHVAGLIGAEGNNSFGIAGVNWQVTLMPVRFLSAQGTGNTLAGVDTIVYAVKNGARIINASWGSDTGSNALKDALIYARDRGTLVVCAAGNNSRDTDAKPQYPSAYDVDSVVAVAATDSASAVATFSNYGRSSVDVAAPGVSLLSTVPGNTFQSLSGTSMATPLVSGIAALMLAQNPALSMLELRNGILNAVKPRSSLQARISTEGEVSADMALRQLESGYQIWPHHVTLRIGQQIQFTPFQATGATTWTSSNSAVATISANGTLKGIATGEAQVTASDGTGRSVTSGAIAVLPAVSTTPNPGPGCNIENTDRTRRATTNPWGNLWLPLAVCFMALRPKRNVLKK